MYDRIKLLRKQGLSWEAIGQQIQAHPEKARSIFRRNHNNNNGSVGTERTKEIDLPSEELSLPNLLNRRLSDTQRRLEAATAKSSWLTLDTNRDVVLIALVGDPHIDDNYCNFTLLNEHVKLFKDNPDIFVVPLGDTTNNWVGRLQKEYADQDTTKTQSLQLIEWFFDSIRPRVNIQGNHDAWSAQESFVSYVMSKQKGIDAQWQAKVTLRFPNGYEYRCWFSHDFPGKSKTNPNYSELNRLLSAGEHVDLLACGHRHYWSIQKSENEWTNKTYLLARAKGYKDWDQYAITHGFGQQRTGHTVGVVVDSKGSVAAFEDLEEALEYYIYKEDSQLAKN